MMQVTRINSDAMNHAMRKSESSSRIRKRKGLNNLLRRYVPFQLSRNVVSHPCQSSLRLLPENML